MTVRHCVEALVKGEIMPNRFMGLVAGADSSEWKFEVVLTKEHLRHAIDSCLGGALSPEELRQWAELVEMCEQIVTESSERLNDILFSLANPELDGALTEERLRLLLFELG